MSNPGSTSPAPLNPLLPVMVPLVVAAVISGFVLNALFPPNAAKSAGAAKWKEVGADAGLTSRSEIHPYLVQKHLPPPVLVFDFDGDGLPDLFFPGRHAVFADDPENGDLPARPQLLRNDGQGHFTDVTVGSGLEEPPASMQASAADYDGDGKPDVFIAAIGGNRLYHNEGGGHFRDVTASSGLGGTERLWSTGSAWLDLDGDGRLDLVVCHYAEWPEDVGFQMAVSIDVLGRSYGAPVGFRGVAPTVYRNLGDGVFARVTTPSGIGSVDTQTGFPPLGALAVIPVDGNDDGLLDLLVLYAEDRTDLFVANGDGTFHPWLPEAGSRIEGIGPDLLASNAYRMTKASGDPRWDAWFYHTSLARRPSGERVRQWSEDRGLALLDYDHEGGFSAWVRPHGSATGGETPFPQLLANRGERWLPMTMPEAFAGVIWGTANAVSVFDFDGDGNLDLLLTRAGERPLLLRNEQTGAAPWLAVELLAERPGDAVGARVEVRTPGKTTTQTYAPALTPFAQSPSTLWFGLGGDARVQKVTVRWKDGTLQELHPEAVNRLLRVSKRPSKP